MLDAEGRAEYFEKLNTYANSADVLFVDNFFLNPYTTATGFFLDLAPLVNADNTINAQDFYPVAWQAFQWEGGMWALPYAFNLQLLNYHKGLFDEAGLDYPNEDWQMGDFIHAAETLQVINEQGEIDFSPLMPLNPALLVLSMIGNYYDDSTIPNQPEFTHPALAEMFALLLDYYQSYQFKPVTSYLLNSVPLNLSFPYQLSRSENNVMGINHEDWVVTLPPGGRAFTQSQGFAISRGTSNPEAAYRFLKFLTGNPDVVASASETYSAQRNLPDIESSYPVMTFVFSPEVEAFLAESVENAIPASEARFALAFSLVRNEVESTGVDVATAIDSLQVRALSLLIEAQSYQSDRVGVASPQTRRERDVDKITLDFGLNSMGVNMVRSDWEEVVDGFVANHPTVTHINIHESMYGAGGLDTSLDCYYDGFSQLAFAQTPPTAFIALDPLIDADPNFDPADFWAGILEQAQVGGGTYGYPIIIQPITL